jgi:hypothetical protein
MCTSHRYFFVMKKLHYRISRALINMPKGIPTHNLTDHYATLSKYKKHILCNTWWPMDMQVVNIIGMTSGNDHTRTREIDVVRPTWLIIHPWQKMGIVLSGTKHLFTLQMMSPSCERRFGSIISNGCCKLGNIPRKMGPPQKEFISIKTFPRRTSLQVMLI